MNEQLFRKQSIEKVTSPESLNDYIKVSNPGIWLILVGAAVLLFGGLVWAIFGQARSYVSTVTVVEGGNGKTYVKESGIGRVTSGDIIELDQWTFKAENIPKTPVEVDGSMNEYAMHLGEFNEGDWVFILEQPMNIQDGVYSSRIITESIHPISFLINAKGEE